MDAKITKQRIGRMLSYDWIKIIAVAVAAIIVWTLVFTMTATRILPSQQFAVISYEGNSFGEKFYDHYGKALENDFSYEVIETGVTDLSTAGSEMYTVLEARLTTYEGDVLFVADAENKSSAYEEDGEEKYRTYLYDFMYSRFSYYLWDLDLESETGFFKSMEKYLAEFYTEGYQNADSLDEAKVEATFRARVKKNKDKRYKKEAEIKQGVQDEIERIQKYRDALEAFYGYLDKGYVTMTKTEIYNEEKPEELLRSGVYTINLCPNVDTMDGLKDIVAYRMTYLDDEGTERVKVTAENMNVGIFRFSVVEKGFEFEPLLYINSVIESCCSELNK